MNGAGRKRWRPTRARAAGAAQQRAEVAVCLGAVERRGARTSQGAGRATRAVAARPATPMHARSICCRRRSGASATSRPPKRRRAASSRNSKSPWGFTPLPNRSRNGVSSRPSSTSSRRSSPGCAARRRTRRSMSDPPAASRLRLPGAGQYDKAIRVRGARNCRRAIPRWPAPDRREPRRQEVRRRGGRREDGAPEHPNDLRMTRRHARALRLNGKGDQAVAILEEALKNHSGEPLATSRSRRSIRTPTGAPRRCGCCRTRRRSFRR